MSVSSVDLSTYVLVNRFDLPEPTRTTPPDKTSLLAQEVSAITFNWDTGTLFVVGDGGTSIVQVTPTGQLIDSMTLAPGSSPQGTEFYDTEGLTYVGGGKFVMTEERDRNAVEFTYAANTMLTRDKAETVHLGTFVGNVGLEGLTYDPQTGGFIFVKETQPEGIFQTTIDFAAHTSSNGTPGVEPANLFDPMLVNVLDFADIYALSNLKSLDGQPDSSHLLVLSQESGKIVEVDRAGTVYSSLTIVSPASNPLSVADQQHEGLTMDAAGNLYVVSENGGGDFDHPQVWVYAPSSAVNLAPTAIALISQVTSIAENANTAARIKVANVAITDDGLGTNTLSLTGADAGNFEVDSSGLYIKAGTILDFETKTSYSVTVSVDDPAAGTTPDASTSFTLTVTDVVNETPVHATVFISEVAPWSSGNSPLAADWFEVTNTGSTAIDITGWKVDDNSDSFASAVALSGITSIAAGESVIFIETADLASARAAFLSTWFGANPPANLQIGSYSGGGVGLSTGGDHVNLFNSSGTLQASIAFDTSPAGPFPTFDNSAGVTNATVATLSAVGVHGAFAAANDKAEIGSPGTIGKLFISEVAPWSSGDSPVGADWFEVTNTTAFAIDITGWKMDDSSGSPAAAVALSGITTIAAGESVIFIETANLASARAAFLSTWFGANPPANLQIGSYSGSGVGLGTGGDAVNLYDSHNVLQASVTFGASPAGPFATFDNAAGLNNATISMLSVAGTNGAFVAANDTKETGSPGEITPVNTPPTITSPAAASVAENTTVTTIVYDANATDAESTGLQFSLTGADAGRFSIDTNSGEVRFLASPDFEAPTDTGANNVYDLIVHANDGVNDTAKAVAITVTNVAGETWVGGNQGESHTGTGEEDNLSGGGGNDTLIGGGGNDVLDGGTGVNTASYSGASKGFEVSVSAGQQVIIVKDRLGMEGQDTVSHVQFLHFADQTLDAATLVDAASLAPSAFVPLIDLYNAYLHRAPDAVGIGYWASRLSDGMTLNDIAKSFFASAEAAAAREPGQSFTALVTSAYNDILGRAPDAGGLSYWVAELQTGRMAPEKFPLAFVLGAHAAGGADAQSLASLENIGAYYALEQGLNNVEHARAILDLPSGSAVIDVEAARGQIDGYAAAAASPASAELVVKLVGVHADEIAPLT